MNCPACNDYSEVAKEGDGDYVLWCDCGYHEVILQNKQEYLR